MTTGCLTITIDRIGGNISAYMKRATAPASATAARVGGIIANMGLVCGAGIGIDGILWASDAKLITIDGGYLIVADK